MFLVYGNLLITGWARGIMTKEELEFLYLNRFAETFPEFPAGEVIKAENPDFLICNGQEKIGIELTRIFRKPPIDGSSPPRAQEELRERIVTLAKAKCDEMGIAPVHASVFFNEFHSFKKTDVEPMAGRVASLIAKLLPDTGCSIQEEYMWTNRDYFPEEVAIISIYRVASLTETFISAPTAGFLPHLSQNEVQEEIDKKEKKINGYLESCNKAEA
jgi:hypothetical protein